jgi:hypothetical protein
VQSELDNELARFTAKLELAQSADSSQAPYTYEELIVYLAKNDPTKALQLKSMKAVDIYQWLYTMEKQSQRSEQEQGVEEWLTPEV